MSVRSRDLTEIASRSFEFMVKLGRDVGNLILLIVLNVVPIVNFIVLGYFAKVVRYDFSDPPKLSDYGGLFIEGLKLTVAVIIYALVPIMILLVGAVVTGFFGVIGPGLRFLEGVGLALVVLGIVLLLLAMFIGLSALSIYMRTGDFAKVFAIGEAWDLISRFGLANYVLLYLVVIVFGLIAAALGSLIPWVGGAIAGVFASAFIFKSLSLFVNVKYPIPPPPPPSSYGA